MVFWMVDIASDLPSLMAPVRWMQSMNKNGLDSSRRQTLELTLYSDRNRQTQRIKASLALTLDDLRD